MHRILITGANRGLGLGLATRYAAMGWRVFATCRQPEQAKSLHAVADRYPDVSLHRLDISDFAAAQNLAAELRNERLDVLLNNAAVYGYRACFGAVDHEEWLRVFAVNAIAPMRLAEAFVDHVARSERKAIVALSSKMGSIGDNNSGNSYIYRTTKTALNMVYRSMAVDLAPRGIACAVIHPGWVKTDMGGPNALIDVDTSVTGMVKVIDHLTLETSGKFYNYDGREIPW